MLPIRCTKTPAVYHPLPHEIILMKSLFSRGLSTLLAGVSSDDGKDGVTTAQGSLKH